jgi:hypothetical protein
LETLQIIGHDYLTRAHLDDNNPVLDKNSTNQNSITWNSTNWNNGENLESNTNVDINTWLSETTPPQSLLPLTHGVDHPGLAQPGYFGPVAALALNHSEASTFQSSPESHTSASSAYSILQVPYTTPLSGEHSWTPSPSPHPGESSDTANTATGAPKKVYKCPDPGCPKEFDTSEQLSQHKKRHKKPFECRFENCEKRFSAQSERDRHERSAQHGGGQTFTCEHCPTKNFTRKDNYMRHMREYHHPEPAPRGGRSA